ncbi:MAG: hypothetical protein IPL96_07275 [Holophagaceae bacterium]|nr:hypothetical protein [Holophagaceae bacterium]
MRPLLLALLAATPVLLAQAPAPALTADQLIAKNIEAEGGLARRKAVKTVRMTGKLVGAPMEIILVAENKRPASFRVDVTLQGQTQSTAFDGKAGWRVNPFAGYGGGKAAEPMTADEIKDSEVQADMDGPLVDYAAKGHKVEYLGTESVEGGTAHKLRVTYKNGNSSIMRLRRRAVPEGQGDQQAQDARPGRGDRHCLRRLQGGRRPPLPPFHRAGRRGPAPAPEDPDGQGGTGRGDRRRPSRSPACP